MPRRKDPSDISPALVTKISETRKCGIKSRKPLLKRCACGSPINGHDDFCRGCYAKECGMDAPLTTSLDSFFMGTRGY